jgi:hypothetical protein
MRSPKLCLCVVGLAVSPLLLAACGSGGGSPGGNPEAGSDSGHMMPEGGTPEGGEKHHDAGGDTEKADAGCANDVVPAKVTKDLTLTLACSPWHVHAPGSMVGGSASPVLTIEPGVTVLFDKGAFLSVAVDAPAKPGGIVAVGTPAAPITFTSAAATPAAGDWASLAIGDAALSTSTVGFASFEYGGAMNNDGFSNAIAAGTLMVHSASTLTLSLHDLKLSHNAGNGIALDGMQVGYASTSKGLKVEDWGNGDAPFVISADSASTLPVTIAAPGGVVDVICGNNCTPGTGGQSIVDVTQTWPAIPIPYLIDGNGLQIEGAGSAHATLTIAPKNTLQFKSGGSLLLDPNGSAQADLVASGVTFTSNSPAPSPGAWDGIHFNITVSGLAGTSLVDSNVEWAGGFFALPACDESCCLALGAVFLDATGDTLAPDSVTGATITGCTFSGDPSASYGIITSDILPSDVSTYTTANTFTGTTNTVCSL